MMAATAELEVEGPAGPAQHDAVETLVVLEVADPLERQTERVLAHRTGKVGDGAGNAQMSLHAGEPAVGGARSCTKRAQRTRDRTPSNKGRCSGTRQRSARLPRR